MAIKINAINTMNNEITQYPTISACVHHCVELSKRTGYTFQLYNADTGKLEGNIRPNHRLYKGKYTARFIRHD